MIDLVKSQLGQSIGTLQAVLGDLNIAEAVVLAATLTANAMKDGHKLMVAGNGGSAADAQHVAAEFVSRLTVDRPAMRALALTTDTSILTAIGNDYSYDDVFARQVEALGQRGDVFLGISTSGNSINLVNALKRSTQLGITTVGYIGDRGGAMAPLCDVAVVVPSKITMNIQESHLALEHIFCMIVERIYFAESLETFKLEAGSSYQ
jgi:D-sedoheptulose 7-phosphate isomerase